MSQHTYVFDVNMTCSGCSGAINRVLEKAKTAHEVSEYNVSLETKEVRVTTELPYDDILAKLSKTGKKILSGRVVS